MLNIEDIVSLDVLVNSLDARFANALYPVSLFSIWRHLLQIQHGAGRTESPCLDKTCCTH